MSAGTLQASSRVRLLVLIVLMLLLASGASDASPSKLISTEWLQSNLLRTDLRIVDVRGDVKEYWENHIPGAVYLSLDALRWADHGVPGKLMPPEALATLLGRMGVSEKTLVVVYAEQNDFKPTYLIWALDYLRDDSAVMLEGGFARWLKEGRPLTQDYPKIEPAKYHLSVVLDGRVRATLEEVKKVVLSGGAVILDVRPAELYSGEKGPWKRKGHIRGAVNHFWGEDLNPDGTWKTTEELRSAYERLGATPDKTIIVSCGQGQMSSHTYFTLKYILDYGNVKNYDGSFNEWSNVPELPVETGLK
jgi:thiosulfate/3-mercaptopyruvate sulfurtransferase